MGENLPGMVLDQAPDVWWKGIDSPAQIAIVSHGATEQSDWAQTSLERDGLRTRLYLGFVGDVTAFEIAVAVPDARLVQISIKDGPVEYTHEVQVKGGDEQGIVRFSKSGDGWYVSPSYLSVAGPVDGGGSQLSETEARITKTPVEYKAAVESLLEAMPALRSGVETVDLVVDISASMRGVLASDALTRFAAGAWSLAWAAGGVAKTATMVGQSVHREPIPETTQAADWVSQTRLAQSSGMATETPYALDHVLEAIPDKTLAVCLTDACPVRLQNLVEADGGLVVVYAVSAATGDETKNGRIVFMGWDGQTDPIAALLAAIPPFGITN